MKLAIASWVVLVPVLAFGANTGDMSFYKHAAEGGIAEVDAGKLAQDKGNSQAVKEFGAMMVKDHSAANDKLKGIADSKSISLPATAGSSDMVSKAKLAVLSGDTFDTAYIKGQIKAHINTVALFKNEIAAGTDTEAKSFAADTLPTVRAHLQLIKKIAADPRTMSR